MYDDAQYRERSLATPGRSEYYCTKKRPKRQMPMMYDDAKVMRTSSQLTLITARIVRRPM
jgi:hypothetical protein